MELKPGYKQTEVGVVPEDWVVDELMTVCERISVGLATSVTKHYRAQGVPIIRNLNIKNGYFDSSEMLYLDPEFAKKNLSKAAKALDVLTVHTGSNLGLTCVLPFEFHNCQTFTTLITTPIKSKLDPYFLCYHMSSSQGKNEIQRLQVGGGKGNLNTSDLKKYYFAFPSSKPEQSAIANALSDADALIQSLIRLIVKKRQIKQGAMQTLLNPYENGRLKAGWVVKKLGDVANICRGASPRPIDSPVWFDENSDIGWVRISDITKAKKYLKTTVQNLSGEGVKHSRYVPSNNLIMSICATVGRPILNQIDVCIHDGFVVFGNCTVDKQYLYYFLDSVEQDWSKHGQTGSQMNLNTRLINDTDLPMPKVLSEQTRIATILSDMDAEIAALETKLAKCRNIKQGMMQNLLNGRIRLI